MAPPRPPVWLRTLLLIVVGLILAVNLGDLAGDRGIQNAASMILGALGLAGTWLWLAFSAQLPTVARRAVRYGGLALALVCWIPVRVVGFSGNLIPELAWRFAAPPAPLRELGPGSAPGPAPGSAPGSAPEPDAAGPDRARVPVDLATTTPEDFPGFLGPERSGAVDDLRLARDWEAHPPTLLWRRAVGAGWSGFAVVNGVAVTLEQRGERELATAYDALSGAPLWATGWPARFRHILGGDGPRSTPTIHGGRVYCLGAEGRLSCLEGADGSLVWERDLLADYGVSPAQEAQQVQYGRANSPLVVGRAVVLPVGGVRGGRMAGLAAFDADTGELLWEGPPRQVSFSSPALATLAGRRQLLIVNENTLSGHDPDTGALLWEHPWPGVSAGNASASQARPLPPDRVFVSKGYGVGAALLRLVPGEGELSVQELWHEPRLLRTKFSNVVIRGGHAYGLSDGILECVDLQAGRRVWKHGRYGHGQVLGVGEVLLLLSEGGELLLIEATPDEPDAVLGRLRVLEGKCWNNLALYGDVLLLRNGSEAVAYRLATEPDPGH